MATEVNFLQSRKEMFLSLSLTALIDDVNGLEPYILHWQVIRYAGSNSCSTTLKLTKLTFSQRLTVTLGSSNCHLLPKDVSNMGLCATSSYGLACFNGSHEMLVYFGHLSD